jgi:hypothetical protein
MKKENKSVLPVFKRTYRSNSIRPGSNVEYSTKDIEVMELIDRVGLPDSYYLRTGIPKPAHLLDHQAPKY